MLILGIDPGLATTGYGIVAVEKGKTKPVTFGAILTKADSPTTDRLLYLYERLSELAIKHQPEVAAVEQLFFNRNVSSALAVGQARGVALLCLAQHGIGVHEYTPLQVKLNLTGHGRAEKMQVGYMVRALLNLTEVPRPDDVADALAVALCHASHAGSSLTRAVGNTIM